MLLTYVDESYGGTYYWIAALICPEEAANPLGRALDGVVETAARKYEGIGTRAELHGHALFHGKDDWGPLQTMPRARIGVYNDAFAAIAEHDVKFIIRGVDVPRLQKRYTFPDHPHSVVLTHLLERVDEYAARQDQLALIIADEIDDAAEHRRNFWHFQRYSTGGYKARQIKRIVDTIHFAPSVSSRLLQAADLVAYLHHRRMAKADRHARAIRANDALWGRIESQVLPGAQCWHP